jgi:uncharacterized protein YbgA (DUF1722 family)/uncharacterized protein YbbK (DUF523 family)
MRKSDKPVVVISKCLGFAHCRFNGLTISSHTVDKLKLHVDFRPVCPEVEIGLGVPRDPIRVVKRADGLRLVQPATGNDVTDKMTEFAESFLGSVEDADGFILKSRSPSCGIKDVKIYPGMGKVGSGLRGSGFFGGAVIEKFPGLPVEDEGRLTNFNIREHFLTKLFTMSRFRAVKSSNSMKELVQFHTENKLLLMAYNQERMRILGRIVANPDKRPFGELIRDYEEHLMGAFSKASRYTSNINVLMHGLGYFSDELSSNEKAFFLDSLERYRSGSIPLSVPLNIIRSLIVRFQEDYLVQQTFFEPYPEELMEITDSGKGRDTGI